MGQDGMTHSFPHSSEYGKVKLYRVKKENERKGGLYADS